MVIVYTALIMAALYLSFYFVFTVIPAILFKDPSRYAKLLVFWLVWAIVVMLYWDTDVFKTLLFAAFMLEVSVYVQLAEDKEADDRIRCEIEKQQDLDLEQRQLELLLLRLNRRGY